MPLRLPTLLCATLVAVASPVAAQSPSAPCVGAACASHAEPASAGVLSLREVTAFYPVGPQGLHIELEGATFAPEGTLAIVNGAYVRATAVSPTAVRFDVALRAGRNEVAVYGVDAGGAGLSARTALWAGDRSQTVRVVDASGAPLDGARVRVALADDPDVAVEGVARGGALTVPNVPPRALVVTAEAGERFGTAAALGDGGTVQVVATGFGAADRGLAPGLDGWAGDAVELVPHRADVGPHGDGPAPELGSDGDPDLALGTAGEGARRATRAFHVALDTRAVTVRYRYATDEVPGGYAGSEYSDTFGVTLRSEGGERAWEHVSVAALGRDAFDAEGRTAWRELTLPVRGGALVQVELAVANVGDAAGPSRVVVDRIAESTLAITGATLRDNSLFQGSLQACHGGTLLQPLNYFSLGVTEFWGGTTRVWGDLALEGTPGDALTDVRLEAVVGGRVVGSGTLSAPAGGDLLAAFGADGRVETSQAGSAPLFSVPGERVRPGDAPVALRLRATAASGATATRRLGTVPALLHYPGTNRYGSASHDAEQGGDAWAQWAALQWAVDVSAHPLSSAFLFNDFANMNGGKFPIHCTHRTGEIVDVTYVGLPSKSAEAAQYLVDFLNGPNGARVERVQTTYALNDSFGQVLAAAGTLTDGRRALDVVGILSGHPTHMHVTLFPDGGQAGGGSVRLAGGGAPSGQAWAERGARLGAATDADLVLAPDGALAVDVVVNPVVDGRVAFEARGASGHEVRAVVYDVVGRVIARGTTRTDGTGTASGGLDLGAPASGLYILRLDAGGEVAVTPFVVAR